jgi:flagellin
MSTFSQINTNIQSQLAFQNLSETSEELQTRQQRLTTGLRINSAEDDAAGFEIANQLEARTGAQGQALRNIGDSKSLLSTAEGSLDTQLNILQTAKEKATQAANDSLSDSERSAIQGELNELTSEIQDIAKGAEFNGKQLLNGDFEGSGNELSFQTGADADDTFEVSLQDSRATGDNLDVGVNKEKLDGANKGRETNFDQSTDKIGDSFSFDGGDLGLQGVDGSGSTATVDGSNGDFLADDGTLNNLEGGEFTLNITGDESSDFTVEVEGNDGTPAGTTTVAAGTNAGEIDSGQTVTLEEGGDGGGNTDKLNLDLSGANAANLENAIDDAGGEAQLQVEVGADGVEFKNDVTTEEGATDAISNIDNAIDSLTGQLSDLGATQNRLSFKEGNLETSRTNLNAAQSRIEDADFAREQTQVAKLQVQQQSGTAQLAQANAAGQSVLSLLQ